MIKLNPDKTKAILIGTTKFADFNDIIPVDNNLSEFAKVLANKDIFGLLADKNIKIIKEATDQELKLKLIEYTKTAKKEGIKTLIVYFAGHGFRNREGKYFLATKNSVKDLIRLDGSTALSYETVKSIINNSGIDQKIILIDACYSGSVAQGEGEQIFEEYRAKGTYTLTSSDSTELSYFDTDATHTIFTGELLNILKNGLVNIEQEQVSLSDLYSELRTSVKKKKPGMSPQQLASKEIIGSNFLFFRNKGFDKQAIMRREILGQITKGDEFYKELNFTNAELTYSRIKSKISDEKIEIDTKTIRELNEKINDCRQIIKYEQVFDNRYKVKYKQVGEKAQKQIVELQQQNAEKKDKIEELKNLIENKKATIAGLKIEMDDYKNQKGNNVEKSRYNEIVKEKQKLGQELKKHEEESKQQKLEIQQLKKELDKNEAKAKRLNTQLGNLKQKHKSLQSGYDLLKTDFNNKVSQKIKKNYIIALPIVVILLIFAYWQPWNKNSTIQNPVKEKDTIAEAQVVNDNKINVKGIGVGIFLDKVTETLDNSSFEMILVKGGTFQMGSNDGEKDEQPVHEVTVPGFYIGKYEVTQKLWSEIMGNNPSKFNNCDDCPVENVSWDDVQEFLKKLNVKTGKKYRLPTEAEWEFAAKGGKEKTASSIKESMLINTKQKYAGSNIIDEVAWYDGNSGDKTHPVGQKKPNGLSIYDMSGNVWEWCGDKYGSYQETPTDGSAWEGGNSSGRVNRGGSWNYNAKNCRSANRDNDYPAGSSDYLGFRLVRSL